VARLPEPPVNNQQIITSAPATITAVPTDPPPGGGGGPAVENLANLPATMASTNIEDQKRVHFEAVNSVSGRGSPAHKQHSSRSVSLLTSLKNTYQAKLDHSPVKSGTSGILNKLHEKLAATRSNPASGGGNVTGSNGTSSSTSGSGYSSAHVPPLSNLDVPKLRDLKSHSFPPIPFATTTTSACTNSHEMIFNNKTATNIINTNTTINETGNGSDNCVNLTSTNNISSSHLHLHHQPYVDYYLGPLENNITGIDSNNIITSSNSCISNHHQVYPSSLNTLNTDTNSQYILHDTEEDSYLTSSYETTDDRRRKWLQYNHNNNARDG
jgi:hypothetical protein